MRNRFQNGVDGAAAERGASAAGVAGADGGADADADADAGAGAAAGGAVAERPDRRVRRVRLSDVAERANVSTSTASRALNGIGELSDNTRTAVIRAAEELDFRPSPAARSLRTRRSHTVGLVVPTVAHAFYAAVTTGAQAALQQSGYRLILVDSGEDPQSVTEAVRTLLDHEVDGLLVSTAPFGAEQFNELLGTTPCVFIDELAPGAGAGNVVLENGRGTELLVDHVVEHGHTRIAFLGGPEDRTSGYERQAAFIRAMERHALPVTDELITQCEWTITSGFEGATKLLDRTPKPTALVTASGELGLGALAAARRARIEIPAQLALVVFDDLYFAPLLEPSLTGIAYDARAIGHEGARLLLGVVGNDGNTGREVRIDVSLVRRRSCGCDYDPGVELAEAVA